MLCQILAENYRKILHHLLKQSPNSKPMKMSWNDCTRTFLRTKVMSSFPKSRGQSQPAITRSCIFVISASGASAVIARSHEIRARLVKRCPKKNTEHNQIAMGTFFFLKTWAMKMVFSKEERDMIISKSKKTSLPRRWMIPLKCQVQISTWQVCATEKKAIQLSIKIQSY